MSDKFSIEGKKVIITGACGGLGRGVAKGLKDAGAIVCSMDFSDKLIDIAKEDSIDYTVKVNLMDRDDLNRAFNEAVNKLGGEVDVLLNFAGIQKRHPCEEFPVEDWDAVIEVNLTAVFEMSKLAGNCMLKQGHGKIINVASMLSFFGGKNVPAYTASKGGVMQLTRALAVAWADRNVQVNAIAPGYMATEMNTQLLQDPVRKAEIENRIPAKRWGTSEDILGPIIFLASEASDYLSGAIIPVDGGYMSC